MLSTATYSLIQIVRESTFYGCLYDFKTGSDCMCSQGTLSIQFSDLSANKTEKAVIEREMTQTRSNPNPHVLNGLYFTVSQTKDLFPLPKASEPQPGRAGLRKCRFSLKRTLEG